MRKKERERERERREEREQNCARSDSRRKGHDHAGHWQTLKGPGILTNAAPQWAWAVGPNASTSNQRYGLGTIPAISKPRNPGLKPKKNLSQPRLRWEWGEGRALARGSMGLQANPPTTKKILNPKGTMTSNFERMAETSYNPTTRLIRS